MPALFGPVLTNTAKLDNFLSYYRVGRFSAAKIVTGWGVDEGGWNSINRWRLVQAVPRLVVRSTAGDPSNREALWHLHSDTVIAEFREWVQLRPNIWLELGNEPDVVWEQQGRDENLIWVYRWWLAETIQRLRIEFPQARLIAPSVRVGVSGWERWLEVLADVMSKCDTVSLHLYGWHTIVGDGKREYELAKSVYDRLFPAKSVAVTELGINNPLMSPAEKLRRYRMFARIVPTNWRWVLFYHYNERGDVHPEYHIPRQVVVAT